MLLFFDKLNELLASGRPFVMVTVVDTTGSVPQDVGSKMLVTTAGLYYGTVGGGKVEARAIQEAKAMLCGWNVRGQVDANDCYTSVAANGSNPPEDGCASKSDSRAEARLSIAAVSGNFNTRFWNWSLHKDIGMTCGGSVKMFMEAFQCNPWRITVFGAGHISNALMRLLINLDCRITCYDTRQEWLDKLPESARLVKVCSPSLVAEVSLIPENDFLLLMTMGHSTDLPVLVEILKSRAPHVTPYIGVIGSDAKAARLRRDVLEAGLDPSHTKRFECPMGLPFGTNDPHEIAVSISAQLLQVRDALRAAAHLPTGSQSQTESQSPPASQAQSKSQPASQT